MIQKLNALVEKARGGFFFVFLAYAALSIINRFITFIDICNYSTASYIIYSLFNVLWYLAIYSVGAFFLFKKDEGHSKLYFLMLFGYSTVSYFYSAWNWITNFSEIYNPTFVTVTLRIANTIVGLGTACFAVSFILSLFLKKDFFKYLICGGLLGMIVGYVLVWFVYIIGIFTGNFSWTYIFTGLVSILYVVLLALGVQFLGGNSFKYATFGENNKNAKEEVSVEEAA